MGTYDQLHYFPQPLRVAGDDQTRAYWAIDPVGSLVLFVHGFRGSAVKTWSDFPGLLPGHRSGAGADMIYYGYDGARTRADDSASHLYRFLDSLGTVPADVINQSLPNGAPPRPADFRYDEITVVAHSLGSVVSRRALLNAHRDERPWREKVKLVLFAPAHKGSDVMKIYLESLTIFVPKASAIESMLKVAYPVLRDLSVGCPTLNQLLAEVEEATERGKKNKYLLARKVIRGDRDRVAEPLPFSGDATTVVIAGRGHSDICKPSPGFMDPVEQVAEVL